MSCFSSHRNSRQGITITPGSVETSGIRIISILMFFGTIHYKILYRNIFASKSPNKIAAVRIVGSQIKTVLRPSPQICISEGMVKDCFNRYSPARKKAFCQNRHSYSILLEDLPGYLLRSQNAPPAEPVPMSHLHDKRSYFPEYQ